VRVTAIASLPLAAVLVAAGPAAVTGLYGSGFLRAADLVPLAALGAVIAPVSQLCATYWAAVGKLRVTLSAGIVGGLVDLALAFWLIPKHGATGAVVASLAGQLVTAVGTVVFTWRAVGRFRSGLRGWLAAGSAAAAGAAAGRQCVDLVGGLLPGAIVGSIVCLLVFAMAAAALSRLRAPALSEQDGAWLTGTLPRFLAPVVAGSLVAAQSRRNADQ
jgi:O-antigen/teichoic acid export membrane protein